MARIHVQKRWHHTETYPDTHTETCVCSIYLCWDKWEKNLQWNLVYKWCVSQSLLDSLIHIYQYAQVQGTVSSISCLCSFFLWGLYLTITCNDRDIKIMIMPFANAALSTHARTCEERSAWKKAEYVQCLLSLTVQSLIKDSTCLSKDQMKTLWRTTPMRMTLTNILNTSKNKQSKVLYETNFSYPNKRFLMEISIIVESNIPVKAQSY